MYLTLGYISIGRGQWPLDWQSGVTGGSSIQETGPEAVLRLQEVPNSSELPRGGGSYSGVLQRRTRSAVKPRNQEEQCGFRPGCGTLDQLHAPHRVLEGFTGVLPTRSICTTESVG